MKKLLAILLAAVMVVCVFAGCAQKTTETQAPAANKTNTEAADASNETVALTLWGAE